MSTVLPTRLFHALAEGRGDAEAVALLRAAQDGRRLLLLRGVRDTACEARHPRAELVRRAYDLLVTAQEADPAAAAPAIGYPTVASWAVHTIAALTGQEAASERTDPGRLAGAAAAAAVRAGIAAEIEVPAVGGAVFLPSLGCLPATERLVTVRGGDVGGAGWQGVRTLIAESAGSRVEFTLDDLDPDRMPGAVLRAGRLTDEEAGRWERLLAEAWAILTERHRETAEATRRLISVLTPLAPPEHGTRSATSKEAIGNIGLSTPRDAHGFAVTLLHETQHVKLSALLDIVALTLPDDGSRYYAPWRADPRPLGGLLQGAYAHMGIAGFWRVEREVLGGAEREHADAEFARWRTVTARAVETLRDSGRLTEAGAELVAIMGRTLGAWCAEPLPQAALDRAAGAADRHLAQWRQDVTPAR
jgi:uncharacterized protein